MWPIQPSSDRRLWLLRSFRGPSEPLAVFVRRIDGTRANTIDALWAQPASQVTMEQHNEFYRFIANAFDTPRYHFQVRETQSTK